MPFERLHEVSKRRIKSPTVLPSSATAASHLQLLVSAQIIMCTVDDGKRCRQNASISRLTLRLDQITRPSPGEYTKPMPTW